MFLEGAHIKEYFEYFYKYPIYIFEVLSGFLPIFIFILNFKVNYSQSKIIGLYVLSILILELSNNYLSLYGLNNHKVYLIFYIFETIVLYIYYKNLFKDNLQINLMFVIILIIVGLFINNLIFDTLIDDISGSVQSLGFILLTIFVFYHILNNLNYNNIFDSSLFWINVGNLFYFSGKLFVFTIMKSINTDGSNEDIIDLWGIVSVMLIFQRICLCIGIYKLKFNLVNQQYHD